MKKERIAFLGSGCQTPARTDKRGHCCKMVNLRNHNGSLQPIGIPKTLYHIADKNRELAYVHVCNESRHYITCNGNTFYHEFDSTDGQTITINKELLTLDEKPTEINSLGNTLLIICSSGIYYLLHKPSGYVILGNQPPMPVISLHEIDHGARGDSLENYYMDGKKETIDDVTLTEFSNRIIGMYYKLRDMQYERHYFTQPVLARYALRLFDGSHILPSPPILLGRKNIDNLSAEQYVFISYIEKQNTTVIEPISLYLLAYGIGYLIEDMQLQNWSDVVMGIDFFVSSETPIISDEKIKLNDYVKLSDTRYRYSHHGPLIDIGKIEQSIKDESLYYKIGSIENIGEARCGTLCEVEHDIRPDYVMYQQRLTVDTANFNHFGARHSYVYNNMLHLANITKKYFEGFPASLFHTEITEEDTSVEACIVVKLKLRDGDKNEVAWRGSIPHFTPVLSPMLSYPDANAVSMEIRIRHNGYEYRHLYPLEIMGNENRASYLQPKLADIDIAAWDKTALNDSNLADLPAESSSIVRHYGNQMYVSELNNPFFFPAEQCYAISGGSIMGIATTTAALSQGQYGEFPLYIFTDEGIWTMQHGEGSICYARCTPINREIIREGSCIVPIENAIVYTTENALSMISGAESSIVLSFAEFSEETFDKQLPLLMPTATTACIDNHPLTDFFNGAVCMGYLHHEKEMMFCNKSFPYTLALHLPSLHLYRQSRQYATLLNGYNSMLAQDKGGVLYDLCQELPAQVAIALVTRPIGENDSYYRLRQVAWRMEGNPVYLSLLITGSHEVDGTNGLLYKATYNGHIAGHLPLRLTTPPYKYHRLLLHGTVRENFRIDCADLIIDTCENNKLR